MSAAAPGHHPHTIRVDLSVLLPAVEHERDQCVDRLIERLRGERGLVDAHVVHAGEGAGGASPSPDSQLCLHYDPAVLPLRSVVRAAEACGAAVAERYRHESLRVTGMDCADCAASLEHVVARRPGVLGVSVSYAAERMRLEYDAQATDRSELESTVRAMGYEVEGQDEHDHRAPLLLPVLSGLALLGGFVAEVALDLPAFVWLPAYAVAYVSGGYEPARHGIAAALRLRFDIDLLMVLAAVGAAGLGHWAEGAFLLFLFSLGHALEHRALDQARSAIASLSDVSPRTARVRREGAEHEVPADEVLRGDIVVVRPGERIPVDGVVRSGSSAVDQAALTGESMPIPKKADDEVLAGTVNGEGALEVEATRLSRDSMIAQVVDYVDEAQTRKSGTERRTARFEAVYTPLVLLATAAVIVVPPLIANTATPGTLLARLALPLDDSFLRAVALLVAASPCALAISTPSAMLSSLARTARGGILVKGGHALDALASARVIVFDKTGTLTKGRPDVASIEVLGELTEQELLATAAAAESRSTHPFARAIVREAKDRALTLPDVSTARSVPGRGIEAKVGSRTVRVGSADFAAGQLAGSEALARALAKAHDANARPVVIAIDGAPAGVIALIDELRPEAARVVTELREMGIERVVVLSGDDERIAQMVADAVGADEVRAELMPADKVAAIEALRAEHGNVIMVGDGVNDAPALASASVGIAMGASGSDVALETADVALMGDRLDLLPEAVRSGRRARSVVRQNLIVSFAVIAVLVPLALAGIAGIASAIVLHEGSTVVVVGNALRLLR